MLNKPISVVFQAGVLEIQFQKCLKLQLAIFRMSGEDAKGGKRAVKMDKTDPMKFLNPKEPILINKSLSLLTTLPYNSVSKTYENKEVDFEMALEIDGKKERMARKINIKDMLLSKEKSHKFALENPLAVLHFKVQVIFQQEPNGDLPLKTIEEPRNRVSKRTKFNSDQLYKQDSIMQAFKKEQSPTRLDKGRYKTVAFQGAIGEVKISQTCSQQAQNKLKKCSSLNKVGSNEAESDNIRVYSKNSADQQEKLERTVNQYKQKCRQIQGKYRETEVKYKQAEGKYSDLLKVYRELQKKTKEKDSQIQELDASVKELTFRIDSQTKSTKSSEQKKEQAMKSNYQSQISSLKDEIKSYKSQIEKVSKTALNLQESSKNIAYGSQIQIKTLKQKIRLLQRGSTQQNKEVQLYQLQMKDKDDIISDLKNRIYLLDNQNLGLQSQLKNLQLKLQKAKSEHEGQLEELNEKIRQIKQENKSLKIPTMKEIKEDGVDIRKKMENLEKQLEKKEQLLKKITDMKKQCESQRNIESSSLKKQITTLREVIQKLQNQKGNEGESSGIEVKIQMEKMKKQLQSIRKNEKSLLIQKSKLQASNRSLQQDIVKNKLAIANILNAVQQTNNEKLISEVYNLTE